MESGEEEENEELSSPRSPRPLPPDLPTSLDDRRPVAIESGVEDYDVWSGRTTYIQSSISQRPLSYDRKLSSSNRDARGPNNTLPIPAAALLSASEAEDDRKVTEGDRPEGEKRSVLQQALVASSSNGDVERLKRLLSGPSRKYIDLNKLDDEATSPLQYAACFGHLEVVEVLLSNGAEVDLAGRHQWTALMWAVNNRHSEIVKLLMDRGASPAAKSSTGRTASDFLAPESDMFEDLKEQGYQLGSVGVDATDDFYTAGFDQDKFEEEMAESEMKRRMMMESAMVLEVDIGNLRVDSRPETPEEFDEGEPFTWDKALPHQMLVFRESEMDEILDLVITNMTPQRKQQTPLAANAIFLGARYAHYHSQPDIVNKFLENAMNRIGHIIELKQQDMTFLAFWLSNLLILLYYFRKDVNLGQATKSHHARLADLINESYVLIVRDAERRMEKFLDGALLEYSTIPGLEDVHFQNEWRMFRGRNKAPATEQGIRPPSPRTKAKVAPRNVTSILSSTLFVMDLYEIPSVVTTQIMSQLFYWLSSEIFNRVMASRKYLSRSKAMATRMNISVIEDWARSNNRHSEHYDNSSGGPIQNSFVDSANRYFEVLVQLLQWLQCQTSISDNEETLKSTIKQLPRLSPQQLLYTARQYRAEVGEKTLPKAATKYIQTLQKEAAERKAKRKSAKANGSGPDDHLGSDEDDVPDELFLDPAQMLEFEIPSSTDMVISYGAGLGGTNREHAKKYLPTLPYDFLEKLNFGRAKDTSIYENEDFDEE